MENETDILTRVLRLLTYVLVAMAASLLTLTLYGKPQVVTPESTGKLDELEWYIENCFIGTADRVAMEDAAAEAMVDSLGDRWSYYIPAEEMAAYQARKSNTYLGIGITIQPREDDKGFEVEQLEPDGPAKEVGIQVGDIMTHVAGQNVMELGTAGVRKLIQDGTGETVEVVVLRGERELTFQVPLRQIRIAVAEGTMLEDNIGLIRIDNFDDRCASESIAAIQALIAEGAEALIFDVRFNPGGYKSEMVTLLDYLLPAGELFRSVDYTGAEDVDMSAPDCLRMPMAVLVNGRSYSAAEFFAAVLEEYDWAVTVGEPTVGKSYFQHVITLRDGSGVGLSMGKYMTPKGVSLAEVGGLVPQVEVAVEDTMLAQIYAGLVEPMDDPQIIAAIAALKSGN